MRAFQKGFSIKVQQGNCTLAWLLIKVTRELLQTFEENRNQISDFYLLHYFCIFSPLLQSNKFLLMTFWGQLRELGRFPFPIKYGNDLRKVKLNWVESSREFCKSNWVNQLIRNSAKMAHSAEDMSIYVFWKNHFIAIWQKNLSRLNYLFKYPHSVYGQIHLPHLWIRKVITDP